MVGKKERDREREREREKEGEAWKPNTEYCVKGPNIDDMLVILHVMYVIGLVQCYAFFDGVPCMCMI